MTLAVENLHVSIEDKKILKGVNLNVQQGEVHAIMGPNGSGKSTLAHVLMGHPKYAVTEGSILFNGEDITSAAPDERARKGLFLAFQYPMEVPGVPLASFLRQAYSARTGETISVPKFRTLLRDTGTSLRMDEKFLERTLNEGFSGGEKKKCEIFQMAVLKPSMAVLDETDSGLDVDALRIVAEGVNALLGPTLGVMLITHYQRILQYIKPQFVHVMVDGKIVQSGGGELAEQLEQEGYRAFEKAK